MKIYKDGRLWFECTSPQELQGLVQSISNNIDHNYLTSTQIQNLIASARSCYQVPALPTPTTPNTLYYVGSLPPYQVWLFDSNNQQIDLGTSDMNLSNYYTKAEADNKFLSQGQFIDNRYPKDSIYITYTYINPSTFLGGVWELIGGQDLNHNYYPAFAISTDSPGSTIDESLPNVIGRTPSYYASSHWNMSDINAFTRQYGGAFNKLDADKGGAVYDNNKISSGFYFNASTGQVNADGTTYVSQANSTYKNGAQVNVKAIKLFFWRRTDSGSSILQITPLAITQTIDSSSTDNSVPSAEAVYNACKVIPFPDLNHTVDWTSQATNGTVFTAPADGWIDVQGRSTGVSDDYVGGFLSGATWRIPFGGSKWMQGGGRVPVCEGETATLYLQTNVVIDYIGFIYPKIMS